MNQTVDERSPLTHATSRATKNRPNLAWRSYWVTTVIIVEFLSIGFLGWKKLVSSPMEASMIPTVPSLRKAKIPDGTIICQGFAGLAESSAPCPMQWYKAPDAWDPSNGKEGQGGAWSLSLERSSLSVHAPAKKDYWRKTYYDPIIVKDDAPFAYVTLDRSNYYTVTTSFTLTAVRQFDQAGLMVRLDEEHWLKTGIEVVDHRPRLSVVVTNVYSDWSTQDYATYETENSTTTIVPCRVRVHLRGDSFVVEGWINESWEMIRIAHMQSGLGPTADFGQVWAGVFAASPEDQSGSNVVFHSFMVVVGSEFAHNADGNAS